MAKAATKKPKKKAVNGRAKGSRAERDLAKRFASWWGSSFHRSPGSGAFATRGFRSTNVSMEGDLVTEDMSFPFTVESKSYKTWNLESLLGSEQKSLFHGWWDQALRQTPSWKIPLLIMKKNGSRYYAALPLSETFVKFEVSLVFSSPNHSFRVVPLDELLKTDPELWRVRAAELMLTQKK